MADSQRFFATSYLPSAIGYLPSAIRHPPSAHVASSANTLHAIRFLNVSRHFGEVSAVDGVSLDIQDGEFFSMLGPSGSGKTTCLRLIAGFDQPTAGQIYLYGKDVSRL